MCFCDFNLPQKAQHLNSNFFLCMYSESKISTLWHGVCHSLCLGEEMSHAVHKVTDFHPKGCQQQTALSHGEKRAVVRDHEEHLDNDLRWSALERSCFRMDTSRFHNESTGTTECSYYRGRYNMKMSASAENLHCLYKKNFRI